MCAIIVGQVPYDSKVTGLVEHLPVAVSLLSEPGTRRLHSIPLKLRSRADFRDLQVEILSFST